MKFIDETIKTDGKKWKDIYTINKSEPLPGAKSENPGSDYTCNLCGEAFLRNKAVYQLMYHAEQHRSTDFYLKMGAAHAVLQKNGLPVPGLQPLGIDITDSPHSTGPTSTAPSSTSRTSEPPQKTLQTSIKSFSKSPLSDSEAKRFKDLMIMAVVHGGVPFRFFDNPYYRAAMAVLRDKVPVPRQEDLQGLFKRLERQMAQEDRDRYAYSLDIDLWTGRNKNAFLAINVFHLDANFQLQHSLVRLLHFKGKHTGMAIGNSVREIVSQLSGELISCTADHAANMSGVGKALDQENLGCSCHWGHLLSMDILMPRKRNKFDESLRHNWKQQGEQAAAHLEAQNSLAPMPTVVDAEVTDETGRGKRKRIATVRALQAAADGVRGLPVPEPESSSEEDEDDDLSSIDDDVEDDVLDSRDNQPDLGFGDTEDERKWRNRISTLTKLMSKVASHFQMSPAKYEELKKLVDEHNSKGGTLKMPVSAVPTRWTATLEALESITMLEDLIGMVLDKPKNPYTIDFLDKMQKEDTSMGSTGRQPVYQPPHLFYELTRVLVDALKPLHFFTTILQTPAVNIHMPGILIKKAMVSNSKQLMAFASFSSEARADPVTSFKIALAEVTRQRLEKRVEELNTVECAFMALGYLLVPTNRLLLDIKKIPAETDPCGKRAYHVKDIDVIMGTINSVKILQKLEGIDKKKRSPPATATTTRTTAATSSAMSTDSDDDSVDSKASGSGEAPPEVPMSSLEGTLRNELKVWLSGSRSVDGMTGDAADNYFLVPGNLEEWWRRNAGGFFVLHRVAQLVLTARATSVESERTFSKAGYMMSPRRARIKPTTFEKMMLLDQALVRRVPVSARRKINIVKETVDETGKQKVSRVVKMLRSTMSTRSYYLLGQFGHLEKIK